MKIFIQLNDDRTIKCDKTIIGKTLENKATILHFTLAEEMIDKDFYIEFEKPDGAKVSTPKLEIKDKEVEYAIPNSLLDIKGNLKTEVVLRKDGVVFKTYTITFNILNSINATEEIAEQFPDFITDAQKVIDEFQDKIIKADTIITDGSGDKYLSDDGTYKEVEGGTGGTSNYDKLENKPSINNIELSDNKTLDELGIQPKGEYLTEESDPTIPDYVKNISEEDITNWNNKSEFSGDYNDLKNTPELFSGDYNDLTNKPEIPEVPTNISAFENDSNYANKEYVDNAIANLGDEILVITDSNKADTDILAKLNVEFTKYKNNEDYNIYYYNPTKQVIEKAYFDRFSTFDTYYLKTIPVHSSTLSGTIYKDITLQAYSLEFYQLNLKYQDGVITQISSINKYGSRPTLYIPPSAEQVDTLISAALGDVNTILATLTTIEEGE